MEMVTSVLQICSFLIAAFGFFLAFKTFEKNQKLKRAEWLLKLFEKFYEEDRYRQIRTWLDTGEIEFKINLNDAGVSDDEQKFIDFLNFFEFISKLESEGQLSIEDVKDMFEYYLSKIKVSAIANKWIEKYSFEKLRTLLQKI